MTMMKQVVVAVEKSHPTNVVFIGYADGLSFGEQLDQVTQFLSREGEPPTAWDVSIADGFIRVRTPDWIVTTFTRP